MKAIDVMGFAGSFAAGVDQAGFDVIAKREPNEFKGFGTPNFVYNMPWVEAQVADARDWDLPPEQVELLYGCPPCSGFSQLSHANKTTTGPEAEINKCMFWLVDYASRVKPRVVIMESVGVAFKTGRKFMEGLYQRLVRQSGLPYQMWHVNMNAAMVGGDVIRPRYFFVASLDPFGVGLEFVQPRTAWEVVQDLPSQVDNTDKDWGHMTQDTVGSRRFEQTIKWLKEQGRDWKPGTRLPENNQGLEPPEFWRRADRRVSSRSPDGLPVYSHWFSTDPFSTFRWRPDKPYGVVVGAVLNRSIHPVHDRNLTWREAARFMSIPDDWSLRKLVEANSGNELGKAVPTASGKWIAHWAKMAMEGTPGEFAGVQDTDDPDIRVISVQNEKNVAALLEKPPAGSFYAEGYSDPSPGIWLVDRKVRPAKWWQRELLVDEPPTSIIIPAAGKARKPRKVRLPKAVASQVTPEQTMSRSVQRRVAHQQGRIERVPPAEVQAVLDELGIDKKEAAVRLGVSPSRINEITGTHRPGSWLNRDRWPAVETTLRAAGTSQGGR